MAGPRTSLFAAALVAHIVPRLLVVSPIEASLCAMDAEPICRGKVQRDGKRFYEVRVLAALDAWLAFVDTSCICNDMQTLIWNDRMAASAASYGPYQLACSTLEFGTGRPENALDSQKLDLLTAEVTVRVQPYKQPDMCTSAAPERHHLPGYLKGRWAIKPAALSS